MNNQHLYTLRDLAQRFRRYGLSMAWLRREAREGRIPSFKAGRRRLFDPDAVEAALIERAKADAPASAKGGDRD
jgi:hypothetical protein